MARFNLHIRGGSARLNAYFGALHQKFRRNGVVAFAWSCCHRRVDICAKASELSFLRPQITHGHGMEWWKLAAVENNAPLRFILRRTTMQKGHVSQRS
uniref:Uncharacterized protein n=1 Tax=Steinernema glaseri TaxID=37863 RepID=A0A1I7YE98_9BILA